MEIVIIVLLVIVTICCLYLIIDSKRYDGKMIIMTNDDGNKIFSLELNGDPAELPKKKSITFKVDSSGNDA